MVISHGLAMTTANWTEVFSAAWARCNFSTNLHHHCEIRQRAMPTTTPRMKMDMKTAIAKMSHPAYDGSPSGKLTEAASVKMLRSGKCATNPVIALAEFSVAIWYLR